MRLIAFGCSMTYGHGLEDCCVGHDFSAAPLPSEFAWPNLLAKKLNKKCINTSHPGSSNKVITKKILEFQFQPNDKVFVLWTCKSRTAFFYDKNHTIDIGLWIQNSKLRKYYNYFYSDTEGEWDFQTKSFFCKMYLDSLKIQNYHMVLSKNSLDDLYPWNKTTYLPIFFEDIAVDMKSKGKDNLHPGPDAHQRFAENLYNLIS